MDYSSTVSGFASHKMQSTVKTVSGKLVFREQINQRKHLLQIWDSLLETFKYTNSRELDFPV